MEHKAYEFRWREFQNELLHILVDSLLSDDRRKIYSFINDNLECLTDPYEGEPLSNEWYESLEKASIQELGDYALTKYYKVKEEFGLGDSWLPIQNELGLKEKIALLGTAISTFDPGCYGSYFQSPEELKENSSILSQSNIAIVNKFGQYASKLENGIYITF